MRNGFISFEKETEELITEIVRDPHLHGLFLNTLSYLENCGARLIASCEHQSLVQEEMLKHAAEEFRHAFYLKRQLARIGSDHPDYQRESLLGDWEAYHYLYRLNTEASRYLSSLKVPPNEKKRLAYLLITYAIELRAGELYPLYQRALREAKSTVQVQSILLEEEEHLEEMEKELAKVPNHQSHIPIVCKLESECYQKWVLACMGSFCVC